MSSLSPSRPILENAQRSGVAIAALNFYNAETILAHVAAAKTQKASIILQTTESTINYLGLRMILAMANAAAELRERRLQARQLGAARCASRNVLRFLRRSVANQALGNLIF